MDPKKVCKPHFLFRKVFPKIWFWPDKHSHSKTARSLDKDSIGFLPNKSCHIERTLLWRGLSIHYACPISAAKTEDGIIPMDSKISMSNTIGFLFMITPHSLIFADLSSTQDKLHDGKPPDTHSSAASTLLSPPCRSLSCLMLRPDPSCFHSGTYHRLFPHPFQSSLLLLMPNTQ